MFFFNFSRYVLIFVPDVAKETYRIELNKRFFIEIVTNFNEKYTELLILYFFLNI